MAGFSRALLDGYASQVDSQARLYLERIDHSARRMSDLVDDLLNFSRLTRMEMTARSLDLSSMVRALASELLARNPDSPLPFWRAWYFGRIPWRRSTVTPASLYASPRLATIYERLDFVARRAAMPARQSAISSSHSAE